MPGSGEDFAARGAANYQSRRLQLRGHYTSIAERFRDEMGFVPRLGVDNALLYGRINFRPIWAQEKLGIREIGPHWQLDAFRRRDGEGLESRYQDWHLPFNFNDGAFIEVGVNLCATANSPLQHVPVRVGFGSVTLAQGGCR